MRISLLFISAIFASYKNFCSFHGRHSGGLSRYGSPNDCHRLLLSIGQSPIICHEVSSSSVHSLHIGESPGLMIDSCLLSLLCPVIIWTHRPNSFLGSSRSCFDAFLYKVGNQIFDCLWPSIYHHWYGLMVRRLQH